MKTYKSHWTEEQVERLTTLWNADVPAAVIGAEFGVSARSICHQASVRGLVRRPCGGAKRKLAERKKAQVVRAPRPVPPVRPVFITLEPAPLPPLRSRILSQLARGPSDTLNLSSTCGAKEMLVTQTLAVLESEGLVASTTCTGPRPRFWAVAERMVA